MTTTDGQVEYDLSDTQLIDAIVAHSCAKISENGDPHLSLVLLMMWRVTSAHMACAVDAQTRASALALTPKERSIFQAFLDIATFEPEQENTDEHATDGGSPSTDADDSQGL